MNATEIEAFYAPRVEKVLASIVGAANRYAATKPELQLNINFTLSASDATVRGGEVIVRRALGVEQFWQLRIQVAIRDAIEFDSQEPFPPLRIPLAVDWRGLDRFDRVCGRSLPFDSITITRTDISWDGQHWSRFGESEADALVTTLFERTVLHDSPDAGALSQRDGRWLRLDSRPQAGGQGRIWRVRDREQLEGEVFALKEMRYSKPRQSTAYKRFVAEISAAKAIKHPHIVPVIDAYLPTEDNDRSTPFYVMPWAEETLQKGKSYRGNVGAVLELGIKLASALEAAHKAGILHRDVKPANVLLFGHDRVPTLADFGICFMRDGEERLTRTDGDTVGSDDYVAPELRGGRLEDIDERVDVYSLGKTLYYALSGGRVFPLAAFQDPRFDLRRAETPDVALDHFYGILSNTVSDDRELRYRSMTDFREQAQRALENVRRFEPYRDGMYGRKASSSERASRLVGALRSTTDIARADIARESVDDCVAEVASIVNAAVGSEQPLPIPVERQREIARVAAEVLLSAALPLVVADERRSFVRLLSALETPLEEGHRSKAQDVVQALWRAATAAMAYGVASVAWHLERWTHLDAILQLHNSNPYGLIYLDIAEDHSTRTWEWIGDTLAHSDVMRTVAPRTHAILTEVLESTAALLVLGYAIGQPKDRWDEAFTELGAADFPALYSDAWLDSLPRTLRQNAPLSADLAVSLYHLDSNPATAVARLREACSLLTPSLRRAMAQRRHNPFRFHSGTQWARWCGNAEGE